jgi:hypothetical protein
MREIAAAEAAAENAIFPLSLDQIFIHLACGLATCRDSLGNGFNPWMQ